MRALSASQNDLLQEVIRKRKVALRPPALDGTFNFTDEERERLVDAISSEFVETGLRADNEPNERGLQLEELLDRLNSG